MITALFVRHTRNRRGEIPKCRGGASSSSSARSASCLCEPEKRKAYAGFVLAALKPADRVTSVGILPMRSGFRDNATGNPVLKTESANVFAEPRKRLE
jgi:hypothetical protein